MDEPGFFGILPCIPNTCHRHQSLCPVVNDIRRFACTTTARPYKKTIGRHKTPPPSYGYPEKRIFNNTPSRCIDMMKIEVWFPAPERQHPPPKGNDPVLFAGDNYRHFHAKMSIVGFLKRILKFGLKFIFNGRNIRHNRKPCTHLQQLSRTKLERKY